MQKSWRILPHDSGRVELLMRSAGVPAVVAQLLVGRGVYRADDARLFLESKLVGLRDPMELPGVPEASAIVLDAIQKSVPITIYGDYDADGMTGASILVNGLRLLGADVTYFVPNRLEDGYGLSCEAIEKLHRRGRKLIITVDCGITSVQQAVLCKQLGITLIITDHHQLADELPDAAAVVHPRLPGTCYPFGELCGAGVAFKLAWAICQQVCGAEKLTEPMREYLRQSLSLAAIGTIADMVPLLDENRILVHHGLRSLRANPLPGLAELMKITKLIDKSTLLSEDVAFSLAPRLNATGRLGQAQLGIELLTSPPGERVNSLATYIEQLNSSRDSLQRSVQLAASKLATTDFDPEADPALVLAGVGWHLGVIGVVAGRLAEKYGKPVIVISLDQTGGKPGIGSGRAGTPHVNLHEALSECASRLVRFGGHKAAAGLTIAEDQIDDFRSEFYEAVSRQTIDSDSVSEILIDAQAPLGQLNLQTVTQIEQLSPFGQGNPRPVLCSSGVTLAEPSRRMGGGDRHLSVRLTQHNIHIRAVAFGQGDWCDDLNACEGPIDIAYRPVINDFAGRRNVEIQLVDWRPSHAHAPAQTS
ncbi:MAG TPA: single-stranded-DNA-specific exonuclease RecJ [Planctomycetaceae bacterium]|nr:single-stranded-DNA-specific exonuclease RecJ [Planctomycetaceae bacterium]